MKSASQQKPKIFEKILIAIIVLLLCFSLTLFVIFFIQNGQIKFSDKCENKSNNCVTPECVKTSVKISDFLDFSIDPCQDFYGFVCGNFLGDSVFQKLENMTSEEINALITGSVEHLVPKPLALQRDFYRKCLNTTEIDEDNGNTLLNMLQKVGGWPILFGDFWDETKFEWLSATVNSRKLGLPYQIFLKITIKYPSNGNDVFLLSVIPPNYTKMKKDYVDLMTTVAIALGAPTDTPETEFPRVIEFSEQINALIQDEEKVGKSIMWNVSRLVTEFPSISWLDLLKNITKSAGINLNTTVNFKAERYLRNLTNLMSTTPKKVQANYMVWKVIEQYKNYFNSSIQNMFNQVLTQKSLQRDEFCLKEAKTYFPLGAELAYVEKYISPKARSDVKANLALIKQRLIKRIAESDWFDDKTKKLINIHMSKLEEMVGVSDHVYNTQFDNVSEIDQDNNIIETLIELSLQQNDNLFKKLDKNTTELAKQELIVMEANAFYVDEYNILVLPAPLLQGLIYDFYRPNYANFGALGTIIGHELTHAIFVKVLGNEWSNNLTTQYKHSASCISEEFENYTDHVKKFATANSTLHENLADLIGPEIAYQAYQDWTIHHGQELPLPGLNYTSKQLFWILSAAVRCTPPNEIDVLDSNHATPAFSVNLQKRNSVNFASDFKCPTGTIMNPIQKCQVL